MTIKRVGKATASVPTKSTPPATTVKRLLGDIRSLIESARQQTARAVNAGLVMLYWSIGDRIRRDILRQKRAEYGEEIVPTLSAQLTIEYGRGFSRANLFSMIRFTEVFPDLKIVQTVSGQLGWSHFLEIIPLKGERRQGIGGLERSHCCDKGVLQHSERIADEQPLLWHGPCLGVFSRFCKVLLTIRLSISPNLAMGSWPS